MTRDSGRRSSAGLWVLAAVLLGLAMWAVTNSALFRVREVHVQGNVRLHVEDVERLAGIDGEENLVWMSTDDVERAIEQDPWVAGATVGRSLPSTLVLVVEEREPVGWVRDPRGGALVAGDGTVLDRSDGPPPDLPLLGRWARRFEPGDSLDRLDVVRVAATATPEVRSALESVTVEEGELVARMRTGERVFLGDGRALRAKHRAMEAVLGWAEERSGRVRYMDVRVPSAPVLRRG